MRPTTPFGQDREGATVIRPYLRGASAATVAADVVAPPAKGGRTSSLSTAARRGRILPSLALAGTIAIAGSAVVAAPALASGYDTRQGIDRRGSVSSGSVSYLWSGTPFYNWGTYIGGLEATDVGCVSTTSFVSSLRQMGWEIIPIWDASRRRPGASPPRHTSARAPQLRTARGRRRRAARCRP